MKEIETLAEFVAATQSRDLSNCIVQDLDLSAYSHELARVSVRGALFLGCHFEVGTAESLNERGALLFPHLGDLPFNPYRSSLYSASELFAGFDATQPSSYLETPDARIYRWWIETGQGEPSSLLALLARRLHDLSIADAITDLLAGDRAATSKPSLFERRVAIMGGHSMDRSSPAYSEIVELARALALDDACVVSGGGPGAMEAAHLGTWLLDSTAGARREAVASLAPAPDYRHPRWLSLAYDLLDGPLRGIEPRESLSIPTWLYGHEPPNPFATHIAKHFNNSLREEGLVTIANGGIVFAPGSAGTVQEIFQDATQNHYEVGGVACPMVFLGTEYWTEVLPVWQLVQSLSAGRSWGRRVALVETVDEALQALLDLRDA